MITQCRYPQLLVLTAVSVFVFGCSLERAEEEQRQAAEARPVVPVEPIEPVEVFRHDLDPSAPEFEPATPEGVDARDAGNEVAGRIGPTRERLDEILVTGNRPGAPGEADLARKMQAGPLLSPPPESIRPAGEPLYRERYERPDDARVLRVLDQPVSTFSIDVDTGAYANARRWLNQGQLPPQDAVRVEEFINYFDYAYAGPADRAQPFAVHTEVAPTPWNPRTHLLRIGIQGFAVPQAELPASNLVFLVDVSGSMQSPDKLPLLKQSLGMLVNRLDADDRIAIVVYAGASGVALAPTAGSERATILGALQQLEAGGSTNGAAGIRLAYQLARQHFVQGGVNRVILATDGDFNVGLASTEELIDLVQRQREAGIALTTLGFGTGNYNDHLLEQLANEGNGNHAYIDRLSEANKVLGEELSATLLTIAKDVKIQVEFNPAMVSEYRLIGYENRALNEEDFANDRVDAGEIGAGHRVTALYEVSLNGDATRLPARRYAYYADSIRESAGIREVTPVLETELAQLRIRWKPPGSDSSTLTETVILRKDVLDNVDAAGEDFRFAAAVAAFGQKLRGGDYLEDWGYAEIAGLAGGARGADAWGYRGEFLQLVHLAASLDPAAQLSQAPASE